VFETLIHHRKAAIAAWAAVALAALALDAAPTRANTMALRPGVTHPASAPPATELTHRARIAIGRAYARAVRYRIRHAPPARVRIARAHAELAHMQRLGSEHCLATAIYFEARDEPARGQRAVAEVIKARARTPGRPGTICGVVFEGAWRKTGCQFSFACDGRADIPRWRSRWLLANRIAAAAMRRHDRERGIVRGALFYHATYVHPRWSRHMVRVARIGAHVFYRPR
jgi:hypothetical protein